MSLDPTGEYHVTAPTFTDGQLARLQSDANGKLLIAAGAGAANAGFNPVSPSYQPVAASQAAVALSGGSGGAIGDRLDSLIIVPAATSGVGTVTLLDGATTVIVLHGGGTVTDLRAIPIELGLISKNGPWKITTGAAITVLAAGKFT